MRYKRVLLKLSGEALAGEERRGLSIPIIDEFAEEISYASKLGIQIGIVIGAGNFIRGERLKGIDRTVADQMGMLGTLINSLALQNRLEKSGQETALLSALEIPRIAEPLSPQRAISYLETGKIVIIAGGTGNPFFTTDTAAVLRALEIKADLLMKATNVDGIYNTDPKSDPNAKKFETISYREVLKLNLKFMDTTAIQLAMEHNLPILVFNARPKGNLIRALSGERIGSIVKGD